MIELAFEHTEEDTAAYGRYCDRQAAANRSVERRTWLWRWFNVSSNTVFLPMIVGWLHSEFGLPLGGWIDSTVLHGAATASAIWAAAWLYLGLRDRRRAVPLVDAVLKAAREGQFHGPVRVTADDGGIREDGSGYMVSIDWPRVRQIHEFDGNVYLETRVGWVVVIPRRVLTGTGGSTFLEFARHRLRSARLAPSESQTVQTVEFEQTPDDLVGLWRYFLNRMPERKQTNRIGLLALCLPALVVAIMTALVLANLPQARRLGTLGWDAAAALLLLSWPFAAAVALPVYMAWKRSDAGLRHRVRRLISHGQVDRNFLTRKLVSLGPGGVCVDGDGFDGFLSWSQIVRVVLDSDHLFLLEQCGRRGVNGFIVPRSAFHSEFDFVEFARAAESHWARSRAFANEKGPPEGSAGPVEG